MSRAADLYDVVRLTRPIVLNSTRAVEASLAGERITVGMRAVLEMLRDSGPLTVPQIPGAWTSRAKAYSVSSTPSSPPATSPSDRTRTTNARRSTR